MKTSGESRALADDITASFRIGGEDGLDSAFAQEKEGLGVHAADDRDVDRHVHLRALGSDDSGTVRLRAHGGHIAQQSTFQHADTVITRVSERTDALPVVAYRTTSDDARGETYRTDPFDTPCALSVWGVFPNLPVKTPKPLVEAPTPTVAKAIVFPQSRKRTRNAPKDLTGMKVGVMVVRGRAPGNASNNGRLWLLDCACGGTCTDTAWNIVNERHFCSRTCPMRKVELVAGKRGEK